MTRVHLERHRQVYSVEGADAVIQSNSHQDFIVQATLPKNSGRWIDESFDRYNKRIRFPPRFREKSLKSDATLSRFALRSSLPRRLLQEARELLDPVKLALIRLHAHKKIFFR